jgi:nucleotide-binding universal stress UspA family protein
MFTHLLVPLDGSALAESALPAASFFGERCGASVTLIHVVEENPPAAIHGEHHLRSQTEAEEYLRGAGSRYFDPRLKVDYHVHTMTEGGVAQSIAHHQAEFDHDLIVMCTHGRTGANNLVFGSIAQKIAALGTVPVLIVRPHRSNAPAPPFAVTPMLVPLDGSQGHDPGLAAAEELAQRVSGEIHLLYVVPTLATIPGQWEDSTKILPTSTGRMLEMAAEEAASYLEAQRQAVALQGINVSAELDRGDPAKVIAECAGREHSQLVVFATHGRAGMEAIWEGSVASRALSRVTVPVLLIPLARRDPDR